MTDNTPKFCLAPSREYPHLRCSERLELPHFVHIARNKAGEMLICWWADDSLMHMPTIKWPALPHKCDNKCMCFVQSEHREKCDYCGSLMPSNV